MSPMSLKTRKGIWVAVLHVALVSGVGAQFVYDRATLPRVWVRTAPFDPNLPIRGRYVRLRLEAFVGEGLVLPAPVPVVNGPNGNTWTPPAPAVPVVLSVQGNELVAMPGSQADPSGLRASAAVRDGRPVAQLDEALAFFIPEHVADPSRRAEGEELWVEVTVPRSGPPRPIRLGVKKDGLLTPLDVK